MLVVKFILISSIFAFVSAYWLEKTTAKARDNEEFFVLSIESAVLFSSLLRRQ